MSGGETSQQQAEPPTENKDGEPQFQSVTDGGKTTEQDGAAQASPESKTEKNDTVRPDAGNKPGSQKVSSAADGTGRDTKAPKTGDENNLLLWSVLLVISSSRMISFFQKKASTSLH